MPLVDSSRLVPRTGSLPTTAPRAEGSRSWSTLLTVFLVTGLCFGGGFGIWSVNRAIVADAARTQAHADELARDLARHRHERLAAALAARTQRSVPSTPVSVPTIAAPPRAEPRPHRPRREEQPPRQDETCRGPLCGLRRPAPTR